MNFNTIYKGLCRDLMIEGREIGNTRELQDVSFLVDNIDSVFSTVRNPSKTYALAELCWYLTGNRDKAFISQFGSIWERLTDDGATNNSAYGYILQKQEGFNQIEKIIELLKKDPNSRRAVLNINKANPYVIETHDEPCTIALQFLLRDGVLDASGMMRSNDIYFGLPYDIIYFTILQKIIADALGVGYGAYHHHAVSLHAYEHDYEKIEAYAFSDVKISQWKIDHKALQKHAQYIYENATKENIEKLAAELEVISYEN